LRHFFQKDTCTVFAKSRRKKSKGWERCHYHSFTVMRKTGNPTLICKRECPKWIFGRFSVQMVQVQNKWMLGRKHLPPIQKKQQQQIVYRFTQSLYAVFLVFQGWPLYPTSSIATRSSPGIRISVSERLSCLFSRHLYISDGVGQWVFCHFSRHLQCRMQRGRQLLGILWTWPTHRSRVSFSRVDKGLEPVLEEFSLVILSFHEAPIKNRFRICFKIRKFIRMKALENQNYLT